MNSSEVKPMQSLPPEASGVLMTKSERQRNGRAALRRALKLGPWRLTLFAGPMRSGKSAALIGRLAQYQYANLSIHVFYPSADARTSPGEIASRLGVKAAAYPVDSATDILGLLPNNVDVVAVDEAELFDGAELISVVRALVHNGVQVLVAGLDMDFAERPFGAMGELCALADRVEKLTAVCARCGSAFATRTQRLIDGRPAGLSSPAVLVEGTDKQVTYEARCHFCYQRPT